jgi:molybdenum cofactor biosynthesis protein B
MPFKELHRARPTGCGVRTAEHRRTDCQRHRSYANDTSGELLASRSVEVGHRLIARQLLKDDLYKIRAQVATWIADEQVQVVLITGGTGFTGRDSTPEAVECLLDKRIDGFGELSRRCRFSILAARPCRAGRWPGCPTEPGMLPAGLHRGLPYRVGGILAEQLDARHRPCNFVKHLLAEACASRG